MAKAQAKSARPVSKCSYCGAVFKKLEHAQRHERTHTLDRPYECKAPACGKTFARQDTLTRHFRLHTRDQEGSSKKTRDTPLILPGRRRTKSAIDVPSSPPKRREERERRATESYLPSPAPSDSVMELPAFGSSYACLPEVEQRFQPSPRPHASIDTLELYQPYATPESIVSPLPFTADSAVFDLGDYSSTSDDSGSLASIEDEVPMSAAPGHVDFEHIFASFQPTHLPYEPAMPPFIPLNALRMNMGEPFSYDFKPTFIPGYPVYGLHDSSYLAP